MAKKPKPPAIGALPGSEEPPKPPVVAPGLADRLAAKQEQAQEEPKELTDQEAEALAVRVAKTELARLAELSRNGAPLAKEDVAVFVQFLKVFEGRRREPKGKEEYDLTRLTDDEFRQLEALLEKARRR